MISALPSRPLTLPEVNALGRSDDIDLCKPIIALNGNNPMESVIGMYVATESKTTLLGCEEGQTTWIVLETLPAAPLDTDMESVAERVIEWGAATYGPDEIIVVTTPESKDELGEFLPAAPIGKGDVTALESLPIIDKAHPMFCIEDTHEIVALLVFFGGDDTEEFVLANYGFHPERNAWVCIERASMESDSDIEPEADDLTIHDWIERHYDMDELLAIAPE